MPSPGRVSGAAVKSVAVRPTTQSVRLALLVAVGLILFLFESAIPRPLPWLKPGLSNLIVVLALYGFGFTAALTVMLLRVVLGALILGTLLNPVFLFSFFGGLLATCAMGGLRYYGGRVFSIIGVSICGAFVHNVTQLSLAAVLVVANVQVLYLTPLLLLASLFSGTVVGVVAYGLLEKTNHLVSA